MLFIVQTAAAIRNELLVDSLWLGRIYELYERKVVDEKAAFTLLVDTNTLNRH